jgi:hypothetical protein
MSLADDFDAIQAASAPASASAPSLAAQWDATPNTPAQVVPPKVPDSSSFWGDVGHQLGLTARAGVTGVTALPAMVGNALNSGVNLGIRGVNSAAGSNIPQLQMPSNVIQQGMNSAGFAQPQNPTERVVQAATAGMAAAPTSMGLGGILSGSASPVVAAVGNGMKIAPGMQIFGGAGAGAGSQGAAELGLNPWWQLGAGVLGSTLGVGAGSALTSAARGIAGKVGNFTAPPLSGPQAAARADAGVDRTISDLGPQGGSLFSPTEIDPLKQQVASQIQQFPTASPAAAVRAQDFRNLGMQPTLGQITRDPMQFAQEMNLRGVPEVGAPLTQRFNGQNTQLQQNLFSLAGQPADAYAAGTQLQNTLKSIDNQMGSQVTAAYNAARASSGKNLDVPLTGVAQDYAQVMNDFGDKVPSGVRNNFNQLGLMGGTQQKTFSIENAENLLKVINSNQSNDPATNAALGQLRNSVKNAILSADDKGGVFAPARALAAQRFALQDQVPALEAASSGSVTPDAFVNRFVLNGDTNSVLGLSNLLKQHSPATLAEMRAQVGGRLSQGAFGQNSGGDASFAPNRYANVLSNLGDTKLGAFYTPDEIAQLHTIGRVGGYMNSFPSAAPVNTSNTASAITGLLGTGVKKVPYIGPLIQGAQNRAFVTRALAGSLGNAPAPVPPSPLPPLPLGLPSSAPAAYR